VFLVLAALYESLTLPLSIIMIVPMGLLAAMFGVWISKGDNNVFTQIGLIVLVGLSAKNAILIVEFARELEFAGRTPIRAAIEASRLRLRPILMTSVATIAAAVPPALALGPGAESRIPMALVIIGGVAVSTFLTLFVVPCAYSLLSRLESHAHDADLREALTELGELPAGNGHRSQKETLS
jgi:multidrug efflux pump